MTTRTPPTTQIDRFVESLSHYETGERVFNPWAEVCEMDLHEDAPRQRQERLKAHLSADNPRYILAGEGIGYQGGRYSGMAFTSERLLTEGAIPRVGITPRLTSRKLPYSEPSATILWGTLYEHGIAENVILWNAYPFHPQGKRGPLSNRAPTDAELEVGLPIMERLLSLYDGIQVIAVGRKSEELLGSIDGVEFTGVRHPANGGAGKFRAQLAELVSA